MDSNEIERHYETEGEAHLTIAANPWGWDVVLYNWKGRQSWPFRTYEDALAKYDKILDKIEQQLKERRNS